MADSTAQQVNNALYHLYSDEPLEDCLHECIAVGVALQANELIDWAQRELAGYRKDAEYPDYRFAKVQLIGVEHSRGGVTTGPVDLGEFDISNWEFVATNKNAVPWPIGNIVAAITEAEENHQGYIIVSLLANADQLLKEGHRSYTQVYWGVSRDSLEGILQAVRNTGISMLKALSRNAEPEGTKPEQQDAAQALAVVVTAGAGSDENLARKSLAWARWQVYLAAVGLPLAIASVILAYLALH